MHGPDGTGAAPEARGGTAGALAPLRERAVHAARRNDGARDGEAGGGGPREQGRGASGLEHVGEAEAGVGGHARLQLEGAEQFVGGAMQRVAGERASDGAHGVGGLAGGERAGGHSLVDTVRFRAFVADVRADDD